MQRKELIFLTTMALVLSAGVVLGRLSVHAPVEETEPRIPQVAPTTTRSTDWFMRELGATPAQSEKIDSIWAETNQKAQQLNHERGQMERNREQAVYDLLNFYQAVQYSRIIEDYNDQRRELEARQQQLSKAASERTRGILNEDQQKKFDQLMKEGPRPRGGPPGSPGRRTGNQGTTRSAGGS